MTRVLPFRPADQTARERAAGARPEDRRGRLLVEAAAGTGKTTVLLERVLAYVRSGDRPLARIAVVTFTEAAAAELKVRLRLKLSRELTGPEPELAGRLREALADLETAAVGTIHSFAMELLKQRPVEAGVDPGFAVADEFEQRLRRTRAWELLLNRLEPDEPGLAAAWDLGLSREADLRAAAFALAGAERERLPEPHRDFAGLWRAGWERIGAALEEAAAGAKPGGKLLAYVEEALTAYRDLSGQPLGEVQRAVLDGELKIALRAGTAAEAPAKAARARAREALDALQEELFHQRLAELAAWLSGLDPLYQSLARRESRLDFDQLIVRALETLRRHPQVLHDFQRRYPVILVDEFQDTDRLQTDLLLLLAGPEDQEPPGGDGGPRSFFVVGDPKQSIYRFRGADLPNYNRVLRDELGPGSSLYLSQTFRPLPALADWINQVLGRVMGGAAEDWEVEYRRLEARVPEDEPPGGGVLYLDFEASEGSGVEEARQAEAEAFARLLHRLVGQGEGRVRDPETKRVRPARWGDVALLLPKMTVLESYERAFHRLGVPFRVVGGRHYYRRDEVHAAVEILRALADPGDPVAAVSALRGPGFGVSDSDLLAYGLCRPRPRFDTAAPARLDRLESSPAPRRARRAAESLEALRELGRRVRGLPLPELVDEVLEATGLVPFFALRDRGEQRVANLRKVAEVARRVEAAGITSLPAFIRWLEGLLEGEPEESDSPYLEGPGTSVRLMTVHRAKGLEFPVVLLGGLPSGSPGGGERLRLYRREDGELALYLGNKRGTRGWEAARDRDRLLEEAEDRRLLYVATTRARDLLVLPYPEEGTGTAWGPLFQLLYAEGVGRPEDVTVPVQRLDARDLPRPAERRRAARIDPERLVPGRGQALLEERKRRLRPAGSPWQGGPLRPSGEEELPQRPGPAERAGPGPALRLGIAVHELLAGALAGESLEEVALAPEVSPRERRRMESLARTFLDSDLARRARAAEERWIEEPLTLAGRAGRLLDGKLDLAFLEGGAWVMVDHKSDRVRPGEEEERARAYRGQLGLYAEGLARVTGRPVREVVLFFLVTGRPVTLAGDELEALRAEAAALLDGAAEAAAPAAG